MERERLMTDIEASQFLGLKPQTLRNWRYEGKGPKYLKFGNKSVRYRVNDLIEWAEERVVDPAARGRSHARG